MSLELILRTLLDDPSITIEGQLQSLWSGYGQIVRCYSNAKARYYIIKVVKPGNSDEHPRGWGGDVSHQRKMRSYQVEATFYQQYASLTDHLCKVPDLIAIQTLGDKTILVMEDLYYNGYNRTHNEGTRENLAIAIKWLAYFHAKFWQNRGSGLWPVGTYWHLGTRKKEWQAMPDSLYKRKASAITDKLNSARFTTLLHGDVKFANLCFHQDERSVAAVDFQYIGRGAGVVDLAYLLGSCCDEDSLFKLVDYALETYQQHLIDALNWYQISVDSKALTNEITELYPFAWADFYRFLLGWNPDSWKVNTYIKQLSEQALKSI
ncbi:phosphotransferase family protein [Thalassotalea sediminis]|uniref:phosphotransferase family protein n=1 Tax=Thalassotalea sediminis TaxID=1759089 RepID=UPI002572F526|nr:phosphotransferase [Thalassotalea sediminis]